MDEISSSTQAFFNQLTGIITLKAGGENQLVVSFVVSLELMFGSAKQIIAPSNVMVDQDRS